MTDRGERRRRFRVGTQLTRLASCVASRGRERYRDSSVEVAGDEPDPLGWFAQVGMKSGPAGPLVMVHEPLPFEKAMGIEPHPGV